MIVIDFFFSELIQIGNLDWILNECKSQKECEQL